MLPERWFWIEVNVPAMKTRVPTISMSQISPLLIFGMSVRGVWGRARCARVGESCPDRLASAVPAPGLTTTENSCLPPAEALVRARRPAAVPVANWPVGVGEQRADLDRCRVAAGVARVELSAGAVQVRVEEDLTLHELTSQEPVCGNGHRR